MSRFLVLNFQDFGLDHHIKDTIKSHTVFCVCCLAKDVSLLDLDKCKHANFLENFIKPEMDKYKNAICEHCHCMLKKIDIFRKQVEQSFSILNRDNFKISNASSVRKPILESKRTVNIYLPPVRRQMLSDPKPIVTSNDNFNTNTTDVHNVNLPINTEVNTSNKEISTEESNIQQPKITNTSVEEQRIPDEDPLAINEETEIKKVKKENVNVNVKLEPTEAQFEEVTVTETEIQATIPTKKRVLAVTLTKEELSRERVSTAQSWSYLRHKYRCERCLIGFMYQDNLSDHILRKHTAKLESVTCEVCTQVIHPAGGINAHMFRHYTRYECEECHKQFLVFNDALSHYRRVHENVASTGYKCKNCDFTTKNHNEFTLHKLKHQRYTCSDCGLLFTSRTGYRRHMTKAHKKSIYKCARCRTEHESMSSYVTHMRGHGERPSCGDCNVSFKTWHSYSAHLQLSAAHNQKNRYRCAECGMRFVAAVYLRIHTQQRHKNVKSLVCTHCKKSFTLPIELKRHIKKIHNEAMSHLIVCDYCGRAYGTRAHLIKHISDAHSNKSTKKCQVIRKV